MLLLDMNFYRFPFVYITLSVIGGILVQDLAGVNQGMLISLLAAGLVMLFLKRTWRSFVALCLLFLTLGGLYMKEHSSSESYSGEYSALLKVQELKNSDKEWNQGVAEIEMIRDRGNFVLSKEKLLFYTNSKVLEPGMKILAITELKPVQNTNNPGGFDAETFWKSKGIRHFSFLTEADYRMINRLEPGVIQRMATAVRNYMINVLESSFEDDKAGVLKALLLGDKGDLSTEIRDNFANAGAMHLLAVSGLHVGIIAVLLLFFFKQFPKILSNLLAHLIVILLLWGYALITGFSPSVTRAVLMFSLLIASRLAHGQYEPINVVFFAAFVVIILEPYVIYDIGFQLSYLAVLGIFIFYDQLYTTVFVQNRYVRWLWQGTCVGLAAQITTAPVALFYFHQFPNYFVLSNIGVMLLASALMFSSILLLLTFKLSFVGSLVTYVLSFLLAVLMTFVGWIDDLPWSVARGFDLKFYEVMIYGIGVILLILSIRTHYLKYVGVSFLLVFVGSIQYGRYQNLISEHLVILNSEIPIIMVRTAAETVCVTTQPELSKGNKMIIKDYLKLYPSQLETKVLKPTEILKVSRKDTQLEFEMDKTGILISGKDCKVKLHTRMSEFVEDSHFNIMMPHVAVGKGYSLRKGAYILRL